MAEPDDLRFRLEAIAEELAELTLQRLRGSIESGEPASEDERRLTRARRAVEKAAALLAQSGHEG